MAAAYRYYLIKMSKGHIFFLTAIAAVIIIIAAPDLPALPGFAGMRCLNAANQYCIIVGRIILIFNHVIGTIDRNHDLFIVIGTMIIAWFTFTLWESTHRLWLASQDQGRDTKSAIAESARAANAMERVASSLVISANAATESVATYRTGVG